MTATWILLLDVTLTLTVCLIAVLYVAKHLRSLLIELCGTPERAGFWLAFANVSLVLVPLIFALDYSPVVEPIRPVVLEIAGQLKYALIGFIMTLLPLALILLWFIPREKRDLPLHAGR